MKKARKQSQLEDDRINQFQSPRGTYQHFITRSFKNSIPKNMVFDTQSSNQKTFEQSSKASGKSSMFSKFYNHSEDVPKPSINGLKLKKMKKTIEAIYSKKCSRRKISIYEGSKRRPETASHTNFGGNSQSNKTLKKVNSLTKNTGEYNNRKSSSKKCLRSNSRLANNHNHIVGYSKTFKKSKSKRLNSRSKSKNCTSSTNKYSQNKVSGIVKQSKARRPQIIIPSSAQNYMLDERAIRPIFSAKNYRNKNTALHKFYKDKSVAILTSSKQGSSYEQNKSVHQDFSSKKESKGSLFSSTINSNLASFANTNQSRVYKKKSAASIDQTQKSMVILNLKTNASIAHAKTSRKMKDLNHNHKRDKSARELSRPKNDTSTILTHGNLVRKISKARKDGGFSFSIVETQSKGQNVPNDEDTQKTVNINSKKKNFMSKKSKMQGTVKRRGTSDFYEPKKKHIQELISDQRTQPKKKRKKQKMEVDDNINYPIPQQYYSSKSVNPSLISQKNEKPKSKKSSKKMHTEYTDNNSKLQNRHRGNLDPLAPEKETFNFKLRIEEDLEKILKRAPSNPQNKGYLPSPPIPSRNPKVKQKYHINEGAGLKNKPGFHQNQFNIKSYIVDSSTSQNLKTTENSSIAFINESLQLKQVVNNQEGNIEEEEQDIFSDLQIKENEERMDIEIVEEYQPEIKWRMRSILIDWLCEVCSDYQLTRDTFHYATKYIDFLLQKTKKMKKNKFQLIGLTCLFLASKMEEVIPPSAQDLCYFSSGLFDRDEMIDMEEVLVKVSFKIITQQICWKLRPVTLVQWTNLLTSTWDLYIDTSPYLSDYNERDLCSKFRSAEVKSYQL